MSAFSDLLRIVALWRSRAGWLLFGVVLSLLALASGLALMTTSGAVVAAAAVSGIAVAPFALRMFGGLRVVLKYSERLAAHDAMFRALADLRVWFFCKIANNSVGGLGFRHAGDLLSRLVSDIEALDAVYLRIVLPVAGALLILPVIALLVGGHHPLLGVALVMLFAGAAFVMPWVAARAAAEAGKRLTDATSNLRVTVLDAIMGLREVRAFGAEGRMLAQMQARESSLLAAQFAVANRAAFAGAAAFFCGQAALLAVLLAAGTDPAGAIIAVILIAAAFEAIANLPRAGVALGHSAAAATRVLNAADAPALAAEPAVPTALPAGFDLRFEAVDFRWMPDQPLIFDGLTFDVPEGARVAVLGPSGAGKSTLGALALRLVAPDSGHILLGGVDIAAIGSHELHQRVGWLSQATHLFDDTIRRNLLLARPDASEAELWSALDAAHLGDMVRALPDALDTWVGEGGARFSGGQQRRLALARALLSQAAILILDEPTSGLDSETERAFFNTLNEAGTGRTIILIAHRLTGVEKLDRIWRISGGKLVPAAG